MQYVIGFAFTPSQGRVLLQRKSKPPELAGLWSAPGGKVEGYETPRNAMVREWFEETSVAADADVWDHFAVITTAKGDEIHAFRTWEEQVLMNFAATDEPLALFGVQALPLPRVHDLGWLVGMALDVDVIAARVTSRFSL